ncbi:cytochrome c biogenesis protein [Edaphobacter acidisoli]|uniref:Cytochrome c biogenesis protein n=1 Tax=Edaphobacter acidisoli TaxID=2040573 RepID=A0A916VYY0_9BACT|nr:TlpA disulfide reductase family protein [Edaphobacter acidisoli]GGA54321.1 cytochrome c biogenesis protein [Edaphobacter acidisoli]
MTEVEANARRERWVMWGFVAAVVLLGAMGWYRAGSMAGKIAPVAERKSMPELVLDQLGGGEWKMVDHRGQVVLVNYWATWCGPCRDEMPGLARLARELGPQGLAVVGVSIDRGKRERVGEFVDEMKVPYPVVFPSPLSQVDAGLEGVPTTILVDREGRVAKSYVGAVRERDFRTDVEALLREQ